MTPLIHQLAGVSPFNLEQNGIKPFSDQSCQFLHTLSAHIFKHSEAKKYGDLISFAFWTRKSNLSKMKDNFLINRKQTIGRGICLHITPANVPINFAFSMAFGILAGNSNAIKVTSNTSYQVTILCELINKILSEDQFSEISKRLAIFRYNNEDSITQELSNLAMARIIWGGNKTVNAIKSFISHPRCVDICFPDRYSLCLMEANAVNNLNKAELKTLAKNFYNDTLYMNQEACSSPHAVIWRGTSNEISRAKQLFWDEFIALTNETHSFSQNSQTEKFKFLSDICLSLSDVDVVSKMTDTIYRVHLKYVDSKLIELRAHSGFFVESEFDSLLDLKILNNSAVQSITYFGFDPQYILDEIIKCKYQGVDRIIPVGQALDMDVIWDGYDIINSLSRSISVI